MYAYVDVIVAANPGGKRLRRYWESLLPADRPLSGVPIRPRGGESPNLPLVESGTGGNSVARDTRADVWGGHGTVVVPRRVGCRTVEPVQSGPGHTRTNWLISIIHSLPSSINQGAAPAIL